MPGSLAWQPLSAARALATSCGGTLLVEVLVVGDPPPGATPPLGWVRDGAVVAVVAVVVAGAGVLGVVAGVPAVGVVVAVVEAGAVLGGAGTVGVVAAVVVECPLPPQPASANATISAPARSLLNSISFVGS